MHTRTHSWITYTPAYLLAAMIENTFCYLTMMQSSLHQRGGNSHSSWSLRWRLVLKCVFIDTIYMNVMRMESEYEGPDYLVCDSIEEYIRFEQHHLNLTHKVREEDMKVENQYYCNIIQLNRMYTAT